MSNYPRWENATGPVKCKGCHLPCPPGMEIYIKAKGVYYCGECGLVAENAPSGAREGGIEEGFIKELAQCPPEALETSIARSAMYMARQLDCFEVGPREIPAYTKEIRLCVMQVKDMYPPEDETDDTETRRAKVQERRRREQGGI